MFDLTIQKAEPEHKAVLSAMLQPYLSELAEFTGGSARPAAREDYPYLDFYWLEPDRTPLLVWLGKNPCGFALIRTFRDPEDGDEVRELAEFYIQPEVRRCGLGSLVAGWIFASFPGSWQVAVLKQNTRAKTFWTGVLASISGDLQSLEDRRTHIYQFRVNANNNPGISD